MSYIADPRQRIEVYRRLAELESTVGIDDMERELTDRFGTLPPAVKGLLFQLRVKLLASAAHATAVGNENGQISIRLPYLATTDRAALQQLLGDNVRVSRVAVWLPFHDRDDAIWQSRLIEVLEMLQREEVQA